MTKARANSAGRIPSKVLRGEIPAYISVHKRFLSRFVQRYLEQLHQSYLARSTMPEPPDMSGRNPRESYADKQGNKWVQLKPRTIRIKTGQTAEQNFGETPQAPVGRDQYGQYLKSIRSRAAKALATFVADIDDTGGEGINIRTGRLLAATYPGPIINNRLVVGPDQEVTYEGMTAEFNYDSIPYANDPMLTEKRPIIPNEATEQRWIEDALREALADAEIEFNRIRRKQEAKRPKLTPRRVGRKRRR